MPTRGLNIATYRYHIHGTLCGEPIDKKYTSFTQFLVEYGGDKTCLTLDRTKLYRIRKRWNGNEKISKTSYKTQELELMKTNWHLHIDTINEPRQKKITKHVLYFD